VTVISFDAGRERHRRVRPASEPIPSRVLPEWTLGLAEILRHE
jgi:hypothetical protein